MLPPGCWTPPTFTIKKLEQHIVMATKDYSHPIAHLLYGKLCKAFDVWSWCDCDLNMLLTCSLVAGQIRLIQINAADVAPPFERLPLHLQLPRYFCVSAETAQSTWLWKPTAYRWLTRRMNSDTSGNGRFAIKPEAFGRVVQREAFKKGGMFHLSICQPKTSQA